MWHASAGWAMPVRAVYAPARQAGDGGALEGVQLEGVLLRHGAMPRRLLQRACAAACLECWHVRSTCRVLVKHRFFVRSLFSLTCHFMQQPTVQRGVEGPGGLIEFGWHLYLVLQHRDRPCALGLWR